jgi:hypothetical protein
MHSDLKYSTTWLLPPAFWGQPVAGGSPSDLEVFGYPTDLELLAKLQELIDQLARPGLQLSVWGIVLPSVLVNLARVASYLSLASANYKGSEFAATIVSSSNHAVACDPTSHDIWVRYNDTKTKHHDAYLEISARYTCKSHLGSYKLYVELRYYKISRRYRPHVYIEAEIKLEF